MGLKDDYTSTGAKFFRHQEAMRSLANGKGMPVCTHLMPTDMCQHSCAFCSVQTRLGNVLPLRVMETYLDTLLRFGLKAVIVSGGGNPILYRCPETGKGFDDLAGMIHGKGLEIGLITNGMPLKDFSGRKSWQTVKPETLDKLAWIRISMSGLDHPEKTVHVPDVLKENTTLGFSYVFHDSYEEPSEPNHGKVSLFSEAVTPDGKASLGIDRLDELTEAVGNLVRKHRPRYVRLLPNCLEPGKIDERCELLQRMADAVDPSVVFVQRKPPQAPNVCLLGYVHPVLNSDGWIYPCDSCVLNEKAGHRFNEPWRVCRWDEVAKLYESPARSLVDPKKLCPGCVFTRSNLILEGVRNGEPFPMPEGSAEHVNFV